jgi:hypothetical protein
MINAGQDTTTTAPRGKRYCVAAGWEGELWVMTWNDGTRDAGRFICEITARILAFGPRASGCDATSTMRGGG